MALLKPEATILELEVPESLNSRQRSELADLVIEYIYDRTNDGLDKRGRPFKPYSKEYIDSMSGRIGRKGSKVDLQLSGDMLAAMKLKKSSKGSIEIGFSDSENRAKAEGNILGSYGQSSANPSKARDFFGISKSKLKEFINAVED